MQALRGRGARRSRGAPADRALSAGERSRLIALGIEVLTQAALTTEAECRRIIRDAETHAATIVKSARDDMERLTGWLDIDAVVGRGRSSADSGAPGVDPPGAPAARAVVSVRLADGRPRESRPDLPPPVEPPLPSQITTVGQDPGQPVRPAFMQDTGQDGGSLLGRDLEPGYEQDLGSGTGLGNQFFDSAPAADENPWGFMEDDNLVGVGPALLRRVLRRPPGARPQPLD
jgi:hypothetical protein